MNGEEQPLCRHERGVHAHEDSTKRATGNSLRHMEKKFGGLTVPKKGRARIQHGVLTNQLADMDCLNVRHHQLRQLIGA
jgi:hypothetical protein